MASVPVIKLRLKVSPSLGSGAAGSICVDVSSALLPSFSLHSGILVQRFVSHSQEELPLLRPITLFFKKLLRCCGLNDPFSGGFGSYSTVLLVRAYIMLSNAQTRSLSAAAAAAEMCSWVADFDWRRQRIVWSSGFPVVEHVGAAMIEGSIWLGDPVNGNGNVARSSFQFFDVVSICRDAVRLLM
jgi:DNA polymerase sigma